MNHRYPVSGQDRKYEHFQNTMPAFWNGYPSLHGQYQAGQQTMNIPLPAGGTNNYHPFKPFGEMSFPVSHHAVQPYQDSNGFVGGFPQHVMQPYQPQFQMPPSFVQSMPQSYQPQALKMNSLNPFENPLQPIPKRPPYPQQFANPYPKQQFMLKKQQPSGFHSVLNQFKTQDGSMDINKMMGTAGQMMNTFGQVSAMVKGFGGFFKV